jgi:CheY-like chemotaxis protein
MYALLDEACKPFELRAAEKSIELVNEVCPNLPLTVIGDPMRLRQVLVNLLGNAIKFTHTGHVRLHVEGTAPSSALAGSESITIAFHVSDTGPGIPEDKQARIFLAFVQADSATARQYGGSGLGLSITTRLLDLMKTQLRVVSRVGEGSTFSFEVTLGLPPTPQAGHLTHYRHLPGQRVLWVSASGQAVPWYTSVFSLWGLTLEHARTLAEARQALKQHHYKTLFVDVGGEPAEARHATLMALVQDAGADRVCALFGPADTLPPALEQPATQPLVLMKPVSPQDLNRALIGERPQRASAAPLRLDGLTLLVVDDNEVNLLVARATLEGLGAVVQTAADGFSALHLLEASGADAAAEDGQHHDFDAVLMDLNMPGIDGLETTRRWRRTESQRGTGRLPMVALTAADSNDDRQALFDAGLDGFVGKPIQTRQLVAELRGVIVERAVRAAAQPAATSF